jgi:hypothetical protein
MPDSQKNFILRFGDDHNIEGIEGAVGDKFK